MLITLLIRLAGIWTETCSCVHKHAGKLSSGTSLLKRSQYTCHTKSIDVHIHDDDEEEVLAEEGKGEKSLGEWPVHIGTCSESRCIY